jgi:hypothetical protein
VQWEAARSLVQARLIVEKCVTLYPLSPDEHDGWLHFTDELTANGTIITLWIYSPTDTQPEQQILVSRGKEEIIVLTASTVARILGTNEYRRLRWPDNVKEQMFHWVPFFERMFDDEGCVEEQPSAQALFNTGEAVARLTRSCPHFGSALELIIPVSQVLLDHLDLRIADCKGGFGASFIPPTDGNEDQSRLTSSTVEVGTIDVPRVNIVSSAIAGAIAAIIYLVVSRMPHFNATEAVLENYDAVKATHEQICASVICNSNVNADAAAPEVKKESKEPDEVAGCSCNLASCGCV